MMITVLYILLYIFWIVAGIATVVKIVAEYDDTKSSAGPIVKKLDTLNDSVSEKMFIAILLGLIIIAFFLWPLVITYLFFTSTQTKEGVSVSAQPPK